MSPLCCLRLSYASFVSPLCLFVSLYSLLSVSLASPQCLLCASPVSSLLLLCLLAVSLLSPLCPLAVSFESPCCLLRVSSICSFVSPLCLLCVSFVSPLCLPFCLFILLQRPNFFYSSSCTDTSTLIKIIYIYK